ncbi:MAG: sigma-70 family RNA polymerase sigma factor [Planctomycetia bacterium]|nr:sigma-70 family RNA polymerase sigma factor [Planctomycetia bacterium]
MERAAGVGAESDRQLLNRFVRQGEEGAFTELVERHGPSVLGVCRRVLRNEHDAEDVSQGAFLVLARKADRLDWQSSVRNWLCAVAYRLALNARGEPGRPLVQQPAPDVVTLDADPLAVCERRELCLLLDAELHRLPEKYRAPVVLCYLEGKTNQEAARLLGWPAGSMSRRLARARDLLHQRLSERGLALVLLLGLALLSLWGLRGVQPPTTTTSLAQVMHSLRPVEATLQRLGDGDEAPLDRADLRQLASLSANAAEALPQHDSGRERADWARHSAALRQASATLAATVNQGDDRAVRKAARGLHASCQHCHLAFRH